MVLSKPRFIKLWGIFAMKMELDVPPLGVSAFIEGDFMSLLRDLWKNVVKRWIFAFLLGNYNKIDKFPQRLSILKQVEKKGVSGLTKSLIIMKNCFLNEPVKAVF